MTSAAPGQLAPAYVTFLPAASRIQRPDVTRGPFGHAARSAFLAGTDRALVTKPRRAVKNRSRAMTSRRASHVERTRSWTVVSQGSIVEAHAGLYLLLPSAPAPS